MQTLKVGDQLTLARPDPRWWRRLWNFITFKPPPMVTMVAVVTSVSNRDIGTGPWRKRS